MTNIIQHNSYQELLRAVEKTFGHPLLVPSDFEYLANQLFEKTGERLSVSTLMRLWDYSKHVEPRKSTLNILARYIGYNDAFTFFQTLQATQEKPTFSVKKGFFSSRKGIFGLLLAVLGIGVVGLCLFFLGGEEKPRRILNVSELKNTKMYRISSRHGERGELGVLNHALCTTFELAKDRRCLQPGEFAILQYEGVYYLYSVNDDRFVNFSSYLVDVPIAPEGVRLTLTPRDSCFVFSFAWYKNTCTLNLNQGNGIIITDYGVETGDFDDGNMLEIYEVGDFDPTEVLKHFAQLKAEYEKAKRTLIPEQAYCIYTLQDGKGREGKERHYLAADGRLTDAFTDSCRFVLHGISNDTLYASPSFRVCHHLAGRGVPEGCPYGFTIILYGNEQRSVARGYLEVSHFQSETFFGQVFFLGQNGCYAVRCTNAIISSHFAGAFWSVVDADADGSPDIDYSAERQYVWHIEPLEPQVPRTHPSSE